MEKQNNGRVFEPEAKDSLGRRVLVDVVDFQGWTHLFECPIPFLHKWEVHEYYLNLEIQEDGGFVTSVRDISFRVDKVILGIIMNVQR